MSELFPDVPISDHRGTVGAAAYEALYRECQQLKLQNLELLDAKHLLENQNAAYKRCLEDLEAILLKTVIPADGPAEPKETGQG